MKKILRSHPNILIGTLALVFVAVLVVFYWWSVNGVFGQIRDALLPPSPGTVESFNLTDAAKLDFRGLITTSLVGFEPLAPAAATTTAVPSTATSTTVPASTRSVGTNPQSSTDASSIGQQLESITNEVASGTPSGNDPAIVLGMLTFRSISQPIIVGVSAIDLATANLFDSKLASSSNFSNVKVVAPFTVMSSTWVSYSLSFTVTL
jgi:hypothetical protein